MRPVPGDIAPRPCHECRVPWPYQSMPTGAPPVPGLKAPVTPTDIVSWMDPAPREGDNGVGNRTVYGADR